MKTRKKIAKSFCLVILFTILSIIAISDVQAQVRCVNMTCVTNPSFINDTDGDCIFERNEPLFFFGCDGDGIITYDTWQWDLYIAANPTRPGADGVYDMFNQDSNYTYNSTDDLTTNIVLRQGSTVFDVFETLAPSVTYNGSLNYTPPSPPVPAPTYNLSLTKIQYAECNIDTFNDSFLLTSFAVIMVMVALYFLILSKLPALPVFIGVCVILFGLNMRTCFVAAEIFYIVLGIMCIIKGLMNLRFGVNEY